MKRSLRALSLLLSLLLLAAAVAVSFAAYTHQGFKKGVVTTARGAVRFASDLLAARPADSAAGDKLQAVSIGNVDVDTEFLIMNYPTGSPSQYHDRSITYSLLLELLDAEGSLIPAETSGLVYPQLSADGAAFQAMTAPTFTLANQLLPGGSSQSRRYKVRFAPDAAGQYRLRITAVPDEASRKATQNLVLACILQPLHTAAEEPLQPEASGRFTDDHEVAPVRYAAFNYAVSMRSYTGNFTLSWSPELTPDAVSLARFEALGADYEAGSLSATVSNLTADIDLVFFRSAEPAIPADATWPELEELVTFSLSDAAPTD